MGNSCLTNIIQDFACVNQDNPASRVSALPLIISQCDLVITIKDDQYYDRAWCYVEAMMVQTLRAEYGAHMWLEHVPLRRESRTRTQHAKPGLATVYNSDMNWWDAPVHRVTRDEGKKD